MSNRPRYDGSDDAKRASLYFNSLPIEERGALAPLLEHYRQMGIAETLDRVDSAVAFSDRRISEIRGVGEDEFSAISARFVESME